jgi:hypothetical protein
LAITDRPIPQFPLLAEGLSCLAKDLLTLLLLVRLGSQTVGLISSNSKVVMEILLLQLLDGLEGDGGRRRGENGDEGGRGGSMQRHRYTPYSTRREITKTDLHFSCLLLVP